MNLSKEKIALISLPYDYLVDFSAGFDISKQTSFVITDIAVSGVFSNDVDSFSLFTSDFKVVIVYEESVIDNSDFSLIGASLRKAPCPVEILQGKEFVGIEKFANTRFRVEIIADKYVHSLLGDLEGLAEVAIKYKDVLTI